MKHEYKYRVIYQDTDAEGVVYYANYLGFFERGRTELFRQLGIHLKDLKEKHQLIFAVSRVECNYHKPAYYEDELTIITEISRISGAVVTFKQEVLRGDQVLVSALVEVCAVSAKNLKPVRLPESLRKMVGYE